METNKTEPTKTEPAQQENLDSLIQKAKSHISQVKEQVLKYTGKVNHNPYIWLKNKGFTLAEQMIANPENYKSIDIKINLTNILNVKAEAPLVMSPAILDRQELNEKLEKAKEDKKETKK